jgi:hypothetical protein
MQCQFSGVFPRRLYVFDCYSLWLHRLHGSLTSLTPTSHSSATLIHTSLRPFNPSINNTTIDKLSISSATICQITPRTSPSFYHPRRFFTCALIHQATSFPVFVTHTYPDYKDSHHAFIQRTARPRPFRLPYSISHSCYQRPRRVCIHSQKS